MCASWLDILEEQNIQLIDTFEMSNSSLHIKWSVICYHATGSKESWPKRYGMQDCYWNLKLLGSSVKVGQDWREYFQSSCLHSNFKIVVGTGTIILVRTAYLLRGCQILDFALLRLHRDQICAKKKRYKPIIRQFIRLLIVIFLVVLISI